MDDINATYSGDQAVPLEIIKASFLEAVRGQKNKDERGTPFMAFVIPKQCKTFKREEADKFHVVPPMTPNVGEQK